MLKTLIKIVEYIPTLIQVITCWQEIQEKKSEIQENWLGG